ncbi:MAG: hypothetical protein ACK559_33890, partial [bacterium]
MLERIRRAGVATRRRVASGHIAETHCAVRADAVGVRIGEEVRAGRVIHARIVVIGCTVAVLVDVRRVADLRRGGA